MTKKSIEEIYKGVKDPKEHVLLRPNMYIGSVDLITQNMWIMNEDNEMIKKEITFSPGLYKIFDEILVNARDQSYKEKKCDTIKVSIEDDVITVENNGPGIPVVKHKEFKILVPEMIFGQLHTSSNYDDTEKRLTGGTNGLGAKLTNIFSKRFVVETVEKNQKFHQEFTNNMSDRTVPKVKDTKSNSYTKITFEPDYERFNLEGLTEDIIGLFKKRVYDIAGTSYKKMKVWFNDEKIEINNFKQYIDLYIPEETKIIYEETERWQIGIVYCPDEGYEHITYVNGICTYNGGNHVDYIMKNINKKIAEQIQKKFKDIKIRPQQVNDNLKIFINAVIENPSFTSQIKDFLDTKSSKFGSKFEVSDKTMKQLFATGILEQIGDLAKFKAAAVLKKSDGKKTNKIRDMVKLKDAEYAGTAKSIKCTLILTEGDSAKSFVMSAMNILGHEYYGVFPLKGKVLNVRETSEDKLANNKEITDIKKILGLKQGVEYDDVSQLRYGKIIILTDQDVDGSHIKGLLINMFHYFWPSLIKNNNFICALATPIVIATNNRSKEQHIFYNLSEYHQWVNTINATYYTIKYYKGLATNKENEAQIVFTDINKKIVNYIYSEKIDDKAILLAFDKKKADNRKEWLSRYNKDLVINNAEKKIQYVDFINKDLIHFSNYSVQRAIPSLVDGFKPSQRKILFTSFIKKMFNQELKVAQLASSTSELTSYHHGEQSLAETIVNMAQNFVGSNNINIFNPNGMFGTRIKGGSDHGQPRYIFVSLQKLMAKIFRQEDSNVLNYLDEEGMSIEPEYFVPILPMILVNGALGIGTGFSTNIPCFNPLEIIHNIYCLMENRTLTSLKPWYKNFKGTIKRQEDSFEVSGNYSIKKNKIIITELPIGLWTEDYKQHLEKLIDKNIITDYIDRSTAKDIYFEISGDSSLLPHLKLTSMIRLSNMNLYNAKCCISKFTKINDILREFYKVRILFYTKRKNYLIDKFNKDINVLTLKIKFIELVITNKIIVNNQKKANIIKQLITHSFSEDIHDYLLNIPIYSLTFEKIEELKKQKEEMLSKLNKTIHTSEEQMWRTELEEFVVEYNKFLTII